MPTERRADLSCARLLLSGGDPATVGFLRGQVWNIIHTVAKKTRMVGIGARKNNF